MWDMITLNLLSLIAAEISGLPPATIKGLMSVESSFNQNAVSYVGALGLMQVRPLVVDDLFKDRSLKFRSRLKDNLKNPIVNVIVGGLYLRSLNKRYRLNGPDIIAAYNVGPTGWTSGRGRPAGNRYLAKVQKAANKYIGDFAMVPDIHKVIARYVARAVTS